MNNFNVFWFIVFTFDFQNALKRSESARILNCEYIVLKSMSLNLPGPGCKIVVLKKDLEFPIPGVIASEFPGQPETRTKIREKEKVIMQ